MYRSCDFQNGMPPHLYRSLTEIRRDMSRISKEIADTNQRLNIRSMLIELIDDSRSQRNESFILDLEEIVGEAREALDRLGGLEDELTALREELRSTRCAMGV